MRALYDFAYCPGYYNKIRYLAGMCPEKWSFGDNNDNRILINYIEHTFRKLEEENKIIQTPSYALLNTGQFTKYYESIYAHFIPNSNQNAQKWRLDGFFTSYQLLSLKISETPERANYFTNPADLVFDTNCEIIPQYDHIFNDEENRLRIPESVRDSALRTALFDGAIKMARNMIDANYKTAVPQYYKGKIQLLIPIFLTTQNSPDLALVVSKNEDGIKYLGHTCLTIDMAYNNARLIARPDSAWLKP